MINGINIFGRFLRDESNGDSENGGGGAGGADATGGTILSRAKETGEQKQEEEHSEKENVEHTEGAGDFDESYLPAVPEGLPAGVWDQDAVKVLGEKAHALGITKDQFSGIVEQFVSGATAAKTAEDEAYAASLKASEESLVNAWGDQFDATLKGIGDLVTHAGKAVGASDDEISALLTDSTIGNNPLLLRVLGHVSGLLSEDKGKGVMGAGGSVKTSAADEMKSMVSDPTNKYYGALHNPDHLLFKEANDQYNKLAASCGKGF